MALPPAVTLVEVGPRDGFQPIGPFIPTETKIDMVRRLHAAGLSRMEVASFVSDKAVPQLADGAELLAAAHAMPGLDAQVLVPNRRYADRALEAGARHLGLFLSVSEKHNMNNVRRTVADSARDIADLVADLPPGVRVRMNLSTAFDCPFDGPVDPAQVLALLDILLPARSDVELCLCDTTGRVTPDRVEALFAAAVARFPQVPVWAFHGHDTYGLGVANVIAALKGGARVIDASVGGLGGCPFAPGATGNVATEDVVWTLERMDVATGVDLDALLAVAEDAVRLPGASAGGRVRAAMSAARMREMAMP